MPTKVMSNNEVIVMLEVFRAKHNIPAEAIVLGGGGALMLRGIRDTTEDLNVWVDEQYFTQIAKDNKVICHPMVDTVVNPQDDPYFWVRKRNDYFKTEWIDQVQVFDLLTMIIHKRGSLAKVERPLVKRQQDRIDLITLDQLQSHKHRVKNIA